MIIVVANRKGGCGKSTLSINLCAALFNRKNDVGILDCDEVGTSTNWIETRKENKKTINISGYTHRGALKLISHIRELAKKHKTIIIDVAGSDSEVSRTCMTVADVLLIPFKPSQADMDEVAHMQAMVEDMKEINPKARVHFLLNSAKPGTEKTEIKDSLNYFKNYKIIPVKTILYDRKAYRDSLALGSGVIEQKDIKAAKEMKNLTKEIGLW